MKLSLDALQALEAIARRGSFAAAAEELHRVPSAITYTVQKLEQDLDIPLFDRSGHRAALTPAGEALLQEGRHLLRAADALESHVRRVATGFEAQLRIAVSDLLPLTLVYPLIADFYRAQSGTRLQLLREVYGGSWDALIAGRADIALGAPGEGPPGGGYATHLLGMLQFVFAVAPDHPLAAMPEPLAKETILAHRAIAAADSSRSLTPRTSGILTGQDVFTVPDMDAKLAAHLAGLGVGYLPRVLAEHHAAQGTLVIKQVEEEKPVAPFFLAWRTSGAGKAQQWFIERLTKLELPEVTG